MGEVLLSTIKGASHNVPIGYVAPIRSATQVANVERFYRVTRVDRDADEVWGVLVDDPAEPWWRCNERSVAEDATHARSVDGAEP